MFKKNSMVTGILIGIVVIVAGYYGLKYLNVFISRQIFNKAPIFSESTVQVIAIFLNVFPFRYLMLRTDYEYTGRGILLVTFIVGITYFFYYLS